MKAAVYERYGPPEVLKVQQVDKPAPKANEVLVRVHATTVTAGDTRMRAFRVPFSYWIPARLFLGIFGPRQHVLGMELAGVIEEIGNGVTRFKKGDAVFASTGIEAGSKAGAYAEYCCLLEASVIAKKPANLSYEQAATLCVGGRTALYFLRAAGVKAGDRVLVYGASGSVGTFAVQLAKHFGAEVTAVCSGANLELCRSLGADATIDYTKRDFSEDRQAYDVVFDTVGKASYGACMRALKKDGTYLQAVATPAMQLRMALTALTGRRKVVGGGPAPVSEDLELLKKLVEATEIVPVIDRTFSLEQIADAHRYVDTGHKKGNVVIRLLRALCPEVEAVGRA